MPYDNIPGVRGTYLDGSFRIPRGSQLPRLLVLGAASSGLTYEVFNVANVREAEVEFGSGSEIMRAVHEGVAQGSDNVSVMRIGGRQGNVVITDSAAATLTITPEYRDDTVLQRYSLVIVANTTDNYNRILIYDLDDEVWVYDTDDVLALDTGLIDVADTGLDLFDVGDITDPSAAPKLDALVIADFTQQGTATIPANPVAVAGQDGTSMTLVERYAALNSGFHLLDFNDLDMIVAPGTYMDDLNVADGDSLSLWAGPPLDDESDALGYVWQYIYQGKLYTYFVDSSSYFTDLGSQVQSSVTLTTHSTLELDAVQGGVGGDGKFSLEVTIGGGNSATVTEVSGKIVVVVDVSDGVTTTTEAAGYINLALAAFSLSNGLTADQVLVASGDGTTMTGAEAAVDSAGGVGGAAATHAQLTGDVVPAAVTTRFAAGVDAELREVNFAHQLASFCHLASTTWKTIMGSISFKIPPSFSRPGVASWMGSLPEYSTIGTDLAVDSAGDNGSGILGNKFLAGESGYRSNLVTAGDVTDGYAYGGIILTKGDSLPNGSDWAYGVSDADEATDSNGQPVDIGKHIFVSYDWPIHRNAFNGGTSYRGPINVSLLGKLSVMPEKEEPIGVNGLLVDIGSSPRVHSAQQDEAALIRAIGTRRDVNLGYLIVSAKTAAHPDSDYTRSSTIRSVNRELDGIRDIARPYIGKEFTTQRIVSLQTAVDSFLKAERELGYNQGARASISFSRTDKIMGKLTIRLRMVPPFSIETITVETSLAAEESEL
jgi:hypothetical protein